MLQHDLPIHNTGVGRLAFSQTVWRCFARAEGKAPDLFHPIWDELQRPLIEARKSLLLASDEVIRSVMAVHPDAVRLVRHPHDPSKNGIIALLPLTNEGVEALLAGRFSGLDPDLALLSTPDQQPAALYLWLIAMPGNLGRMMSAFATALDSFMPEPIPVFSKAVHAHADRLNASAGFLKADQIYPHCAPDLLVLLPEQTAPRVKPRLEVRVARSVEDLVQVFAVRAATYIAEQFCLYGEEFDGNDLCATHWIGTVNGDPAGCIRVRFFADFAKVERLAVRAEYRNSRLAFQLVRGAIAHCQTKGYQTLFGHSRLDLQRFWQVFGFRPIKDRPLIEFANIQYAEMRLDLPPCPSAIQLTEDPLRLLRPEGDWDRPGPFEAPPAGDTALRQRLLRERTRTVRHTDIRA